MKWLSRIIDFLRFIWPWALQFFFFSLNWMLKSIAAQFTGMPGAVHEIAQEWTLNALAHGHIPLQYEKYVRWVMKSIAWVMIIFGYILACHFVVWIFWRIF